MKRVLAWFAGLAGIAALGRYASRRTYRAPSLENGPETAVSDPAEELRRRLADAREAEPDVATEQDESLEARRARVHAKAREAIDAMDDDGAST